MLKRIGIICASDTELEPFLCCFEKHRIMEKAMLHIHVGTIRNIPVVALYSGVCKVNAAIAAQILIDHFQVDMIINAGTAGGMDSKVQLFDTIISSQMAYHDVSEDILTEFHPWMESVYFHSDDRLTKITEEYQKHLKHTVWFGRSVTGEQFITDERRGEINEKFSPLSVDMETASIAHVCYVNEVPFIAIRTITDTASHIGIENFEANCKMASKISAEIVIELLEKFALP